MFGQEPVKEEPKPESPESLGLPKGVLFRGADAQKAIAADEAEQAERARQRQAKQDNPDKNLWRFGLKDGEKAQITFLDGDLDENGLLDNPSYWEHDIFKQGTFDNQYRCHCDLDTAPCLVCDSDPKAKYLATPFTVIVHTPVKDKKGVVHVDYKRLFVAKTGTLKLLQSMAKMGGSLRYATFNVSRSGALSPRVGSSFDFVGRQTKEYWLQYFTDKKVANPEQYISPADYESIVPYYTVEELRAKGFGSNVLGAGSNATDYSEDI